MKENTKKLLEYGTIGLGILILLLLLLSKSQQPQTQPQQNVAITPAQFNETSAPNFQGIAQPSMNNIALSQGKYNINLIDLMFPWLFMNWKPSQAPTQAPTGSCGICSSNNTLDNYVWS